MKTGPKPVMPQMCETCIFREDGNQVRLRPGRLQEIQCYLIQGTPHLCHTPQGTQEFACRGGRDFQLLIWSRLGIIPEATDEALAERMTAMGVPPPPRRRRRQ